MLTEADYSEEFLYGGDLFALRPCRLEAQATRAYALAQERRTEQENEALAPNHAVAVVRSGIRRRKEAVVGSSRRCSVRS